MKDNKERKFKLSGNPDIVIKFKENSFGIVDFKTTIISEDKAENYRYQLEAYAQIFSNPGSTKKAKTPKLNPITHMGILQFYPEKITDHDDQSCDFKMKTFYSPLSRKEKDFYDFITSLIDLLELPEPPDFDPACNFCNFTIKQIKLSGGINGK